MVYEVNYVLPDWSTQYLFGTGCNIINPLCDKERRRREESADFEIKCGGSHLPS